LPGPVPNPIFANVCAFAPERLQGRGRQRFAAAGARRAPRINTLKIKGFSYSDGRGRRLGGAAGRAAPKGREADERDSRSKEKRGRYCRDRARDLSRPHY